MDQKDFQNKPEGYEYGRDYSNHTSRHSNSFVDESINFADISDMPREQIVEGLGGTHTEGTNTEGSNTEGTNTEGTTQDYYHYGAKEPASENAYYRPYEGPSVPPKKPGKVGKVLKTAVIAVLAVLITVGTFAGTSWLLADVFHVHGNSLTGSADSGANLHITSTESQNTEGSGGAVSKGSAGSAAKGSVTDVSAIAEQSMPSIVSITNVGVTQVQNFFGQTESYKREGAGSGIIISQDDDNLYIVTNNHVIANSTNLTVKFVDDSTVSATVKGADESSDLAVVSVPLKNIKDKTKAKIRTAVFGSSESLQAGQPVVAIGNALGYGQSVTTGVVSALDREVSVQSETDGTTITNLLLQTDAAINPGNSGGALLNLKGEVIGINSVKYSDTEVEGMGYAIPVSKAIPIIQQLITRQVVSGADSAYLGISGVDVTSDVSGTYKMPQGIYVAQVVKGSAAEKAGIAQGDIITGFDGRNITTMKEMQSLLKYYSSGTTIKVTVKRASSGEYKEKTFEVTLGKK